MSRVHIIKTGSTLPSLATRRGDFEDWIVAGMGTDRDAVVVCDVCDGALLPDHDRTPGVVVTGSHSMVTERHEWIERTAEWLSAAVEKRIPVLGICFGHQLLAHAMGGKVRDNPGGREFGTVEVHLEDEAREDPLLAGFSSPITVHASHTQSVVSLPRHATRLASNEKDANQAFVIWGVAWGVQFHPEFDEEIVIEYIRHHRDILAGEGQDPDLLTKAVVPAPLGSEILRRFLTLVRGTGGG